MMKCRDCEAPTEVISRQIGMFGKTDTFCNFCRACLTAHAAEGGYTEAQALAIYDSCTAAVREASEARAEKLASLKITNRPRSRPGSARPRVLASSLAKKKPA